MSVKRTSVVDMKIDQALRRAAQKARMNAAATGTRLIIYEKGRIRRQRPGTSADIFNNFQTGPPARQEAYQELKKQRAEAFRNEFAARRVKKRAVAVAEKKGRYRSASKGK